MKFNFKYIFIGVAIVLAFVLGNQCSNGSKSDLKPITDTFYVHTSDTIYPPLKPITMPYKKVIEYVYIKSPSHALDSLTYQELNQWRLYSSTLSDSNLVLYIENTIQGFHRGRSVNYRLKVPLMIRDSVKMTITKQIPIPVLPNWQIGAGALVTPKGISFMVDYSKNRNTFILGYDPFNKVPTIGYKRILFKSKK